MKYLLALVLGLSLLGDAHGEHPEVSLYKTDKLLDKQLLLQSRYLRLLYEKVMTEHISEWCLQTAEKVRYERGRLKTGPVSLEEYKIIISKANFCRTGANQALLLLTDYILADFELRRR